MISVPSSLTYTRMRCEMLSRVHYRRDECFDAAWLYGRKGLLQAENSIPGRLSVDSRCLAAVHAQSQVAVARQKYLSALPAFHMPC